MLLFSCCSLAVCEAGGLSPKDVGVVSSVLVRMHKALAASPMRGTLRSTSNPAPSPSCGWLTQTVTFPIIPVERRWLLLARALLRQFSQTLA